MQQGLIRALVQLLEDSGISLEAWAFAWARLIPVMTLVPAFGARLFPRQARAVMTLVLSLCLAPALAPLTGGTNHWALQLMIEAGRGFPVALSAASFLWATSMVGSVADDLRSSGQGIKVTMLEPNTPALGALMGLFSAGVFLKLGGVEVVVEALAEPELQWEVPLVAAVDTLTRSIHLAVALAAPMLVAVVVWEVSSALITRAAQPASIQAMMSPIRAMVLLSATALSIEAIFDLMVEWLIPPR